MSIEDITRRHREMSKWGITSRGADETPKKLPTAFIGLGLVKVMSEEMNFYLEHLKQAHSDRDALLALVSAGASS